jgi:hypothetical protein
MQRSPDSARGGSNKQGAKAKSDRTLRAFVGCGKV